MARSAGPAQPHPSPQPSGKPMPEHIRRGNATKSRVRARVEHVFAHQKTVMGLFIRTIGIKRAEAKITLTNLARRFIPAKSCG